MITNCVKKQVSVHDVMAQKGVNDVVALNTYTLKNIISVKPLISARNAGRRLARLHIPAGSKNR